MSKQKFEVISKESDSTDFTSGTKWDLCIFSQQEIKEITVIPPNNIIKSKKERYDSVSKNTKNFINKNTIDDKLKKSINERDNLKKN